MPRGWGRRSRSCVAGGSRDLVPATTTTATAPAAATAAALIATASATTATTASATATAATNRRFVCGGRCGDGRAADCHEPGTQTPKADLADGHRRCPGRDALLRGHRRGSGNSGGGSGGSVGAAHSAAVGPHCRRGGEERPGPRRAARANATSYTSAAVAELSGSSSPTDV